MSGLEHSKNNITGRILVVEDDEIIGGDLETILSSYGLDAFHVSDWAAAMAMVRSTPVDLVLLDQWLGRTDALTMLPEMRGATRAPIVVLTGNKAEADRIVGLEMGADDFLVKPVSGREIVARVRAHLRRRQAQELTSMARANPGWRFVPEERRLYAPDGHPVHLTGTEYELMAFLIAAKGAPIDRDTLSRRILRRAHRPEDRSIDSLVHSIRSKLTARGGLGVISTVRNRGYVFTGFGSEPDA